MSAVRCVKVSIVATERPDRPATPESRRAGIDQAIAGMVTYERIPRSGLSHELDLVRDLLADLASTPP